MALRVVTPPVLEPVSLAEAKQQCRVDPAQRDEDLLIAGYIAAARDYCEGLDWRAYLTQTIELWLDDWPDGDVLKLPRPPLQSVSSITYYDTGDAATTLPTSVYFVDTISQPGRVCLRNGQAWPSATLRDYNAICITYVAGWTTPDLVPEKIKQALRLVIGHYYENRESTQSGTVNRTIEQGVYALLALDQVKTY